MRPVLLELGALPIRQAGNFPPERLHLFPKQKGADHQPSDQNDLEPQQDRQNEDGGDDLSHR